MSSGHRCFTYRLQSSLKHDRGISKSGLEKSGGVRSLNKWDLCLFPWDSVTRQEKCFVKYFQPQFTKENVKDWSRTIAGCKDVLSLQTFQVMPRVNLLYIMLCFRCCLEAILSPYELIQQGGSIFFSLQKRRINVVATCLISEKLWVSASTDIMQCLF